MARTRNSRPDPRQRGVTAVLVAIMIVVLLGFAAWVIDGGLILRAKSELQNAGDSAALGAALELDRTQVGIDRARTVAKMYAGKHNAHDGPVVLRDEDIIFGRWNEADQTFTPQGPNPDNPGIVNAIEIIDRRESGTGNPIGHYLAPIIGVPTSDVNSRAIAISGGPGAECGFPMVVPDCALDETISTGTCDYCMIFQDNGSDNAGWTTFGEGNVGTGTIRDLVYDACHLEDGSVAIDEATGECLGACNEVPAGMEVQVTNANSMSSGNSNYCPVIQDLLLRGGDPDDPTVVAQPFTVSVPVLQSDDAALCDASQFSGTKTIAGFATLEIFGAKCGNADKDGVIVPGTLPCEPPPSDKFVVAVLRCDLESVEPPGGDYFGLDSRHMRLVR